jgi:C-terminal processing protease CtpA/Prc
MKYDIDIAVLINEYTQSYSEALAQSAQYNCNAVLIGSNTAGANQVVTYMKLPGDVALSFTGANALLWNNKTMQKVGITPDIEVHPTIKGISEKRDEVLERAIFYFNQN